MDPEALDFHGEWIRFDGTVRNGLISRWKTGHERKDNNDLALRTDEDVYWSRLRGYK